MKKVPRILKYLILLLLYVVIIGIVNLSRLISKKSVLLESIILEKIHELYGIS